MASCLVCSLAAARFPPLSLPRCESSVLRCYVLPALSQGGDLPAQILLDFFQNPLRPVMSCHIESVHARNSLTAWHLGARIGRAWLSFGVMSCRMGRSAVIWSTFKCASVGSCHIKYPRVPRPSGAESYI